MIAVVLLIFVACFLLEQEQRLSAMLAFRDVHA